VLSNDKSFARVTLLLTAETKPTHRASASFAPSLSSQCWGWSLGVTVTSIHCTEQATLSLKPLRAGSVGRGTCAEWWGFPDTPERVFLPTGISSGESWFRINTKGPRISTGLSHEQLPVQCCV
jgi:hypothetical protein